MDDLVVEFMEIFLKLSPGQRTIVYDFACALLAYKDRTDNQAVDAPEAKYKNALRACMEEKSRCIPVFVDGSSKVW